MDFKFSIGQFVTTAESKENWLWADSQLTDGDRRSYAARGAQPMPIVMTVIERICQECSGGVQTHYLCRYYTRDGYKTDQFNEIELTEHPVIKNKSAQASDAS